MAKDSKQFKELSGEELKQVNGKVKSGKCIDYTEMGQTGSYWSADDEKILSFDTHGREITDHESVNGFSVRPLANYRIYQ